MASIKEIAKICGVSVATVSKALNDKSDIGTETKEYIKEVAKRMGYVPKYYARAIRLNRSFNLGVLFMDDAQSGLTHDYFSYILNSFKVTAELQGYDITFINSSKKSKTYLEHCRYRGLDGVVIACINFDNPEVLELVQSDIPIVTIDHVFEGGYVSVVSNNTTGMKELLEYIISMGHKKIAYISGETSYVTRHRIQSYENTMKKHGLEIPKEYQIHSKYRNLALARKNTKRLLELPDPPTCIIYPDDLAAIGGIELIKDMGLNIPEDISVAGYDDLFIAGQVRPRLTTVHQDTEMIGRKAAETLIAQIESRKKEVLPPVVVDARLESGESIQKLNA